MGFFHQTSTLIRKTLLIVFWRHWFFTTIRAFIAPVLFMWFITYAKNFFIPPSQYGIGSPVPILSLTDALDASVGRDTVAFVNNGFNGGAIGSVIDQLSSTVKAAGWNAVILEHDEQLLKTCRSTLRGVSECYGAVSFHSSPKQGDTGLWQYTMHADAALGSKIFVNRHDNDQEIYLLPLQRAVDTLIAQVEGVSFPSATEEYPITFETQAQRDQIITDDFQSSVIHVLAAAIFIGVVGVCYQLVGHMAIEREIGMTSLLEAMMPNRRRWQPQIARLLATHIAFDIIYMPAWILMGAILRTEIYPQSSAGIFIVLHILVGLALSSWSLFIGAFFRKAQLSGITAVIISIILAIIAETGIEDVGSGGTTGTELALGLLFPPCNYVLFLIHMSEFQEDNSPVSLTAPSPSGISSLTGADFWGFLVAQIFFYFAFAIFIERTLYGTASADRKLKRSDDTSSIAVRLSSFSKHYQPNWFKRAGLALIRRVSKQQVVAVSEFSLEVLEGQIAVLLGANGSGKSTTLDCIAGLSKITKGSIMVDFAGGLGLCPQKNVLWDDLTVIEHVDIFNHLKSTGARESKKQTIDLIAACDLSSKIKAQSKTLSGGQKRKLQLAMMFTGDSRVCCVDEVSSGIDPLARRKVWDILLAERGRRTIILTTHFLDEADVLSDHIAILSKGVLKAEGSAVALKHNLGSGYRVIVDNSVESIEGSNIEKTTRQVDYDHTIYQFDTALETSRFISDLEKNGTRQYRVQGPTIEEVFLKVADELKEQFERDELAPSSPNSEDSVDAATAVTPTLHTKAKHREMNLLPGHGTGLFRQCWVLFRKRFVILQYNYLPHIAALIVPIITAGLTTLFLKTFSPLTCASTAYGVPAAPIFPTTYYGGIVYGPSSAIPESKINSLFPQMSGYYEAQQLYPVDSLSAFYGYVSRNYSSLSGGIYIPQNGSAPTVVYTGADFTSSSSGLVYNSVFAQSILDSLIIKTHISVGYQSFPIAFDQNVGKSLQLVLYFGLAMAAFPAFFALYPTAERLRKVRALHYSNGVRSAPLWIAYCLFDFIFVFIISIVVIAIWITLWDGIWYYPAYLFVVFFLYGLTSTAYSYVISLFTTSQLASFAFSAGSQCALLLLYFIAYLSIIVFGQVSNIDQLVTTAHFTIALITPAGNMLRGILLSLNEFLLICDSRGHIISYGGEIKAFGGPILYLICQYFLLMAFLIWWDSGGRINFFQRSHREKDDESRAIQDPEVVAETTRVESSSDGLRVLHLTKSYWSSGLAVDDVSFGVAKGEVFALLGPNGAGKSTTISLVRGDIRPSTKESEVIVDGASILKRRKAARNHLGVCPQFDAMDQMTVLGHLRFYARARGVADVNHNVHEVMRAVGLTPYAKRMALQLSGGNKRKLSLAIALMGNPSVLLLDEPSSGMDAAAKRVMWHVLDGIKADRSLVITTHSMEEADALAVRAGILATRMLALGTVEDLRRRHGDVHYVHLVHRDAPHTTVAEMDVVKDWVKSNIAGVVLEERTYHGQLRFSVPNVAADEANGTFEAGNSDFSKEHRNGQTISELFDVLESHKDEIGISYYSVSPSTLDQVFLNVVNKHNVEEEDHARLHPTKRRWFNFGKKRN